MDAFAEVVDEIASSQLDPLRRVYVERQDRSGGVVWAWGQHDFGHHLRAETGLWLDGMFYGPDEWAAPDWWCYLPPPIEWTETVAVMLATALAPS